MQTLKYYKDHLITPRSLVIVFDHGAPVTVLNRNSRFEEIKTLLQNGDFEAVPGLVNLALAIETKTKGKFVVVNGTIQINGDLLPKSLSDKLIEFVEEGLSTGPLERFWDNLALNPAESAREDLFSFLEVNQVPLTADGCFVAYKKVKGDWWDSYTGKTYQNLPGKTIKMDRAKVDGDRRNTCSAGLHVAAWGYASGFSGSRILEVKINPRDVVAVPPDYNQQKMRVCQYLVLRQTDKPYARSIYEDAPIEGGRHTGTVEV
jgi:hypothetical protein